MEKISEINALIWSYPVYCSLVCLPEMFIIMKGWLCNGFFIFFRANGKINPAAAMMF